MKPVFDQNTTELALKKVGSWIFRENLVVVSVIFTTPAIFSWWPCGNYLSDAGVVYLMMANDVSPRRKEEGTA